MGDKKLLIISVNADPLGEYGLENQGGQNKRILELCKNLTFKGWDIDVFTSHYEGAKSQTSVTSNFRVIRIPVSEKRKYDNYYFSKDEITNFYLNLKKFITKEQRNYTNLLCFYWLSGVVGIQLGKDLGINFGVSFCSLAEYKEHTYTEEITYRLEREKEIAKKASLIVAQSDYEKIFLVNKYGANPQIIQVIPGGINEKVFFPKYPKILFVGRPVKQKGLLDLINALELLQQYHWELGIVGKRYNEVLSSIDYSPIANRIRHYGSVKNEEVARIMRDYDILVVPSHYENFGNIAIEGMASGLLLIVSNVNGLGELVTHKKNGLHFQVKSPQSLAEQLQFAFTNDIADIRKNAIKESRRFRWKILVEDYNNLLSSNE